MSFILKKESKSTNFSWFYPKFNFMESYYANFLCFSALWVVPFFLQTTISRILESNFTNFSHFSIKFLQFYKMALFLTNFFCFSFCIQSSYFPLHTPVFLSLLLFHLKITSIPLYFLDDSLYFSRNNGVKFYELFSIL